MICKLKDVILKSNTGLDAIRRAPIVNECTGVKCIRITDVSQGKSYEEWGNTKVLSNDFTKFQLKTGDILIARTGATIGVNRYIDKDLSAVYNNGLIRLQINDNLAIPKFIYYVLNTAAYWGRINAVSSGTVAQPNMKMNDLLEFEFNLPDTIDQARIVKILNDLDNKIKMNNEINDNLLQQIKALYNEYFVERKNESWPIIPLHDIVFFQEGPGIRNWQYVEDGINFINIRCINNGDINLTSANKISTDEAYGKYSHFLLKPYDIVMSCSGTLGRYAIVRDDHLPLCLNTSVIRFRPLEDMDDYSFVFGYITSREFLNQQIQMANGSAQVNFGPTHIKKIQLALPPKSLRIDFNNVVMPMINKSIKLNQESKRLVDLRDSLLPKLMSGEIDVSNIKLDL